MNEALSEIDLGEYGVTSDSVTIDPSDTRVSHLPAYAVNALMPHRHLTVRTCDLVEQCSGGAWATRPFDAIGLGYAASKGEFLDQLRTHADWA